MKHCTRCNNLLPADRFGLVRGRRVAECKSCHRDRNNTRNRALRIKVLKHYGGDPPKCACCGENKLEFLSLDHINGGGRQHRKSIKIRWWEWLRKNNYPEGFRVLCHNCNMSLGIYGYCPHHKDSILARAFAAYDETAPNRSYKLESKDVETIRNWIAAGKTGVEIAAAFHVSRATITHIKTGKTWHS